MNLVRRESATRARSPTPHALLPTAAAPLRLPCTLGDVIMPLLIDGYNLLWQAGIVGEGTGPGGFERSRRALLNFIARIVPEEEVPLTTVVFDAKEAPPGLPRETEHCGLRVLYASDYEDADALIEELIVADFAPRRLTVVSSDHRIQRAARRRRCRAVDSDVWYREAIGQQQARLRDDRHEQLPRPENMSEQEVAAWLDAFGDLDLTDLLAELSQAEEPRAQPEQDAKSGKKKKTRRQPPLKPGVPDSPELRNPFPPDFAAGLEEMLGDDRPTNAPTEEDRSLGNPFPPGYGEDLFENDDWLDEPPRKP